MTEHESGETGRRPARTERRDRALLFGARFVRLFAYGLLSVVLVLYLAALGLSEERIGLLLSLTLLGDTVVSLLLTTSADRLGRRRTLCIGAALMVVAALAFASTRSFPLLLAAAIVGVLSPSGGEIGPFLSVEQAALAGLVRPDRRTAVFAWYNLTGSVATALGSLAGGVLCRNATGAALADAAHFRPAVLAYGALGLVMGALFVVLSRGIELAPSARGGSESALPTAREELRLGLGPSRRVVLGLSALFSVDAFAGGLVLQSLLAYWLHLRFGLDPEALGRVFFGANLLAGASALTAGWLARRFGLLNTMVFTHLPSNVLLMLVPLMPSAGSAITLLLLRFSISQMDVPTRQAYLMAVVKPAERSAAAGITTVARSLGAALSPALAGKLLASSALRSLPFFVAGALKIAYDLALWRAFRSVSAEGEAAQRWPRREHP
jgi:MFS family permease